MNKPNLLPKIDVNLPPATQAEIDAAKKTRLKIDSIILAVSSIVGLGLPLAANLSGEITTNPFMALAGLLLIVAAFGLPSLYGALNAHQAELSPIPFVVWEEMLGYCMTTQVSQTYLSQVRAQNREFIWLEYDAMRKHAEAHKTAHALAPDEARRALYEGPSAA